MLQPGKNIIYILLLLAIFASCQIARDNSTTEIKLNSLGYQPSSPKIATIIDATGDFNIVEIKSGKEVFSGTLSAPIQQQDVNQTACLADFSGLDTPGTYYLQTKNGKKSIEFTIASKIYNAPFYTAMRAFYLWRCGTAVEEIQGKDTFKNEVCHLEDGWLDYTEFGHTQKDGTGGWHDAGDHGKYVVSTGVTLGILFMAWENFGDKLKSFDLKLPNTAEGFPDFLKELKWETDFLQKMEYPDGSGRVSHKLTRLNFSGFIMPCDDHEPRYFSAFGTSATAHYCAIMAEAARYFEPYDADYAKKCLAAAERSYNYLAEHPEYIKWDQPEFHTGPYQTNDKDARIWAAAELWETTGEQKYLDDFEAKIENSVSKGDMVWDWENVKNLGIFTYLRSAKTGKKKAIEEPLRLRAIEIADSVVACTNSDIYGRPLEKYYWGCNGTVARLSSNLHMAYELTGNKKYENAAQLIIAHIFGRNFYSRSYVTGLGIHPPMFPHDRRSGADNVVDPWPGYIVGGGHQPTDWVDEEASYTHNEVAINWQAALVYNLAWFIQ